MSGYAAIDALRAVLNAIDDFEVEIEATREEEAALCHFRVDLIRLCRPMIKRAHATYEDKLLEQELRGLA